MNIFDAHISGSLSVSSSAEIQGDLTVLGIINANISGTTTNASTASFAPRYTLTSSFNTFTGDTSNKFTSIETSTSSLNTFTSSANGRLNSIETVTGSISSLNTYTGSNNTVIGTLQTSTSSLNTFTSSADGRLNSIETSTGSLNSYTSSNTTNINAIHTATSSLNSYTSSNTTNINAIHTSTASLNSFTSSADGRLTSIEGVTGSVASLNTYTGSNNTIIGTLQTATSSLNSYTSSNTTNINAIHTATSSLNSYTSSNTSNINAIHTSTSSLNTFTSSASGRLTSLESASGSIRTDFNTFTSSASGRLTALETASSSLNSYTSSNTTTINALNTSTASLNSFTNSVNTGLEFTGSNVTVKGNLLVKGLTTTVESTTISLSDNIIQLNGTGATNAGIVVRDATASTFTSGSFLWDTANDKWIAGPLGSEDDVVLKTASQALTNKTISGASNTLSNIGNGSLTNSSITIAGNSTSLGGSISAATILTSTGVWSGSAQLPSGVVSGSAQLPSGTVSGSSQVSFNGISDKPTLVSGSSQITFLSISSIPSGLVSGSSQVLSGTGIWSGSAQLPSGVVSGSSQVLNGSGVWSGSAQLPSGTVSGSSQITYGSVSGIPSGIVSGSSQITFGSISGIPSGLVSGSSQVLAGTTIHSGSFFNGISVVSGSAQISFGGITGVPSGLVSGSSQVAFGSISGVPSGLVSGSSQVTLSSTTGFGSYLNQAVLTSSSPTFAAITIGKSGTDSTITFPAQTNDPGYIKHYENANTAIMYFSVSDDAGANDYFSFGNTSSGYVEGLRITASGAITVGTWQATAIGDSYISSASNWNTAYNKRPSSLGFTSSTVTLTLGDSSTITASVPTFNQNTTGSAGSLSNMNISQFTNNSGYLTSVTNITGNAGTVGGLTPVQFFNNMGENHSTRTGFDSSTPTYGFGFRFVQGSTNGPGTGGGQFYSWYIGLGNDYPSTGAGSYGAMFAVDRNVTTPYLSVRFNESNSFGSWRKIHAGYADTAGTAGNITSYTINQSVGTSNQPTFAGATLTDRLYLNGGSYEGSILFGSSTTWRCGIRQHDDADAELRIWTVNNSGMIFLANGYNGEPADIARPTDGLVVVSNNVGIGNFSAGDPSYKLHVKGSTGVEGNLVLNNGGYGWIYANDTNHSIIMRGDRNGTAADYTNYYQYGGTISSGKGHKFWTGGVLASQTLRFHIADDYTYNTGNMTVGGTLTENSSIRYKKDIETISYGLDKVLQMRGVTYLKKENDIKEVGVIAEEIAEILPDIVLYDSEGKPDSVSYGRITAVLIEAIKDLKKEINELKNNG